MSAFTPGFRDSALRDGPTAGFALRVGSSRRGPASRRPIGARPPLLAALLLLIPGLAAAQMATGTYVGDGADDRAITGLGFRPDVVVIKGNDGDANHTLTSAVMRTSTMGAGDVSKPMVLDNALTANLVQSLDTDGFTVGSDRRVNQSGITFYWTAFKANADMKVGSYSGNGGTQSVAGLGFSPEYLIVMSAGAARAVHTHSAAPVGRSFEFDSAGRYVNQVTSLDAGGFSVNHDALAPYVNAGGVLHHYVAWNDSPGKVKVGSYDGNATDNRNITGIGFRPEYVIVKQIYDNNVLPNSTPGPHQRPRSMPVDASTDFSTGTATNHIQGFVADGFQIGSATTINRAYADCNLDGPGCAYFYVAFNLVEPDSPPLGTTEGAGSLTVTAPNSFEMVFTTNGSGGIQFFYDLAEDPGRTVDPVSGSGDKQAFFFDAMNAGGSYASYGPDAGTMHLLEATPTRVRVRQEAFYRRLWTEGSDIRAGLKGFGDYSVYSSGRFAVRWDRRTTSAVTYTTADLNFAIHRTSSGALNTWTRCSQTDDTFKNPGTDAFILSKLDVDTARTDFLHVIDKPWTVANGHPTTSDFTDWHTSIFYTNQWTLAQWEENTGFTIPAGSSEIWNFLTYFKPTNLGNVASPWLDPLVTVRSADYQSPDPLSAIGPGSGWNENTADADFFNESEAAYTLDLDPSTGLTFDVDGSTTTRHSPFFKIRQWRSAFAYPAVSLEGTALVKDVDYRADVKPVSRAHFAQDLLWHSTLESSAAVTDPDVGSGATVNGGTTFVAGKYGKAARFAADGDYIEIPDTGLDFDKNAGAVEFWYQPTYAHTDGATHILWHNAIPGIGFALWKQGTNALSFTINDGSTTRDTSITSANYSWRAYDWVHIRAVWADGTMPELWVNGERPPHSDVGPVYDAAAMTTGPSYVGAGIGGGSTSAGIIDEFRTYSAATAPTALAHGGLTSDATEYLADPAKDLPLSFAAVDPDGRGEYAYFGTDSRFRGLNVVLSDAGAGSSPDLQWQYWRGTTGSWEPLESVSGFTDETSSFTKNGTVYWDADPPDWEPYSVNGGTDLYYVRASLASGDYATQAPVESRITTDILLFQYSGDVTAAAQTFSFAAPVPTAVELLSFAASPLDSAVDLSWTTASELDNLGFHVHRSLSETGPWERITPSLIPGLGSSPIGAAYSWRDPGLVNGTRYFYRLEDVDTSSVSTLHGPVSAVPQAGLSGAGGVEGEAGEGGTGEDGGSGSSGAGEDGSGETGSGGSGDEGSGDVGSGGSGSGPGPPSCASSPGTLPCVETYGDPTSVSVRVVSRSSRHAVVELVTGGFEAVHETDGRVRARIPGFEDPGDPHAAALPFKRVVLEGKVGKGSRVSWVRAKGEQSYPGLVPQAVGHREMEVLSDGTVRTGRRWARLRDPGRAEGLPSLARLGEASFVGERKQLSLELYPIRFDAASGGVKLIRRLRVRVEHTGRVALESGKGSRGRRPPGRRGAGGDTLAFLHASVSGLHGASFEALFPGRSRALSMELLSLRRQGQAVPFHVEPPTGSFGPGSVLYFYAERGAESTSYVGEVAYELVRAGGGQPMQRVSASPYGALLTTPSLGPSSHETNRIYQSGLLEAADLWQWEGLVGGVSKTKRFDLSGVETSSGRPGRVVVWLQGGSDAEGVVDHHVRVRVGAEGSAVFVGEALFDGKRPYRFEGEVPAGALGGGTNELVLENVGDAGVYSLVFLDRFEVAYPQRSELRGGVFEGEWAEEGVAQIALPGSAGGTVLPLAVLPRDTVPREARGTRSLVGGLGTVAAVDVTDPARPLWLSGLEPGPGSVLLRAERDRRYVVASPEGVLAPRISAPVASSLMSATNQADYVLIAPEGFLAAARPLLERRQGQGLVTRAVSLEELASVFGHGEASGEAIRAFLTHAYHEWRRPSPRYVVLLGDASHDPRNFSGTSAPAPLPALFLKTSYLVTASDPSLVAVNGEDLLPDLAVGRLPAQTVEEAQALIGKLVAWEESGYGLRGEAVLVADDPDDAGDFEADVLDVRDSFLAERETRTILLSQEGAGTRARILEAFDSGASLMSYVGHGGAAVWASENVWNSWDVSSLRSQGEQPVMLTLNCLNGYFVAPSFDSLGEAYLKAEGRGTIASFSPSGLSLDAAAHQLHRALMRELVSGGHERLGDAILAAQQRYAETGLMPELLSIYHLLGDPGTRIR